MLSLIVELKTIYGEGTSHENDLILGSSNRISSLKKNEDMPENCYGNEYMEGEWGIMVLTARMKMNRSITSEMTNLL